MRNGFGKQRDVELQKIRGRETVLRDSRYSRTGGLWPGAHTVCHNRAVNSWRSKRPNWWLWGGREKRQLETVKENGRYVLADRGKVILLFIHVTSFLPPSAFPASLKGRVYRAGLEVPPSCLRLPPPPRSSALVDSWREDEVCLGNEGGEAHHRFDGSLAAVATKTKTNTKTMAIQSTFWQEVGRLESISVLMSIMTIFWRKMKVFLFHHVSHHYNHC